MRSFMQEFLPLFEVPDLAESTAYIELSVGDTDIFWDQSSAYISDEQFDSLEEYVKKYVPNFDRYGNAYKIGFGTWKSILDDYIVYNQSEGADRLVEWFSEVFVEHDTVTILCL